MYESRPSSDRDLVSAAAEQEPEDLLDDPS